MAEMVNRPHPPNPPDVGGARGGKIPAKNKEKWYYLSANGIKWRAMAHDLPR